MNNLLLIKRSDCLGKKISLFSILLVFILSACSQSTSSDSYAMIVVVNNIVYSGSEEKLEDFRIDKSIGTVIKKVNASQFPSNNQSNFFEEGSIIYSVKDDTDFIIIEDNEGEFHLLQKAQGSNSKYHDK